MSKQETEKMWEGRFESSMANSMERLSFSLHFDQKLLWEDVQASVGHCKGLVKSGVLTEAEAEKMISELVQIREDILGGANLWSEKDEDIHMAVERILTDRLGDLGKKLHSGRSRNDQVATDFRLYMINRAREIEGLLLQLQKTILDLSEKHFGKIMPGYTHVQQAQPILFSHYMMSFFSVLQRDRLRLKSFVEINSNMPLGSGALAGSAFPYERELVAKELGFERVSSNSIDAISHRDAPLELLGHWAITLNTLSRYAEDFVNWSTYEFGFLTLHDAYSSGSSMMPQKKNPDSMELIRGKAGRALGNYTALYTTAKGAPLTYSRDLQEDKEPIFDSYETVKVCLEVMEEALASATWNFETMMDRMLPELLATDLADILVEKSVPFREAHHIVGKIVGIAAKKECSFLELPEEDWEGVPDQKEVREALTFEKAVERRSIQGGTGFSSVKTQLEEAKGLLEQ